MKKKYLIGFVAFFTCIITNAQNIIDDNTTVIEKYFQQEENIASTQISSSQEKLNTEYKSVISVIQEGDENDANIIISGEKKQVLNQIGNKNNYEYYTYENDIKSNTKITQNGDNNDIQIYGQNNLTKNMSIKQNANNQTIIIRNYN